MGNYQIEAGASTDTKLDLGIGRVTYGFSFFSSDKTNAMVRGGLHWAEIDFEIKLSGQVANVSTGKNIARGSTATEGGNIGLAPAASGIFLQLCLPAEFYDPRPAYGIRPKIRQLVRPAARWWHRFYL